MSGIVILASYECYFIRVHEHLVQPPSNNILIIVEYNEIPDSYIPANNRFKRQQVWLRAIVEYFRKARAEESL